MTKRALANGQVQYDVKQGTKKLQLQVRRPARWRRITYSRAIKWPFDSSGFQRGAKCCMGAPCGTDFLSAALGAGSSSAELLSVYLPHRWRALALCCTARERRCPATSTRSSASGARYACILDAQCAC